MKNQTPEPLLDNGKGNMKMGGGNEYKDARSILRNTKIPQVKNRAIGLVGLKNFSNEMYIRRVLKFYYLAYSG